MLQRRGAGSNMLKHKCKLGGLAVACMYVSLLSHLVHLCTQSDHDCMDERLTLRLGRDLHQPDRIVDVRCESVCCMHLCSIYWGSLSNWNQPYTFAFQVVMQNRLCAVGYTKSITKYTVVAHASMHEHFLPVEPDMWWFGLCCVPNPSLHMLQ